MGPWAAGSWPHVVFMEKEPVPARAKRRPAAGPRGPVPLSADTAGVKCRPAACIGVFDFGKVIYII